MTIGDQPAFNWFDVGFWLAGFLFGVGATLVFLGYPKQILKYMLTIKMGLANFTP